MLNAFDSDFASKINKNYNKKTREQSQLPRENMPEYHHHLI